jgi:hypothetical protein
MDRGSTWASSHPAGTSSLTRTSFKAPLASEVLALNERYSGSKIPIPQRRLARDSPWLAAARTIAVNSSSPKPERHIDMIQNLLFYYFALKANRPFFKLHIDTMTLLKQTLNISQADAGERLIVEKNRRSEISHKRTHDTNHFRLTAHFQASVSIR